MVRSRSHAEGFTLLEALVALVILGLVVVVGLESVGLGAAARLRALEASELRILAEDKLAEVSTLSGPELLALTQGSEGGFPPPYDDASWRVRVTDVEVGAGLFLIEVEVIHNGGRLAVSTYANRFGELWAARRAG